MIRKMVEMMGRMQTEQPKNMRPINVADLTWTTPSA